MGLFAGVCFDDGRDLGLVILNLRKINAENATL